MQQLKICKWAKVKIAIFELREKRLFFFVLFQYFDEMGD